MKVAGFVGKCKRTAGSQQGDITACRVSTMWEVTHVRPHISGKDGEYCTLCYIPHLPRLQYVCLCIYVCTMCADVCIWLRTICLLFVYYVIMFVCLFMCLLLPSSFFSAVCAQNEPPTIQKQRADGGFFICLKDYIMWFSVRCVHIHAHTNLVADGGRCHTCTHHTLTVSLVLTQTRFEHVQTDKYRRTQAHTLQWQPPTPPVDDKLDPQVPEGRETERQRKRSVDPVMCVWFTPQPPVLSFSLILLFPSSKLQIQQSVRSTFSLLNAHVNIPPIFICFVLCPTHGLCTPVTCEMTHENSLWRATNLNTRRTKTHSMKRVRLSSLTFCVLNYILTWVAGLHADFENVIWKMHPATRTSGQSWTHTLRWNILLDGA